MGAYAIYSDKPFRIPADKLHCTRKPNARLERAMSLIDNADEINFDMENERMLFLKDGKILNDDFKK